MKIERWIEPFRERGRRKRPPRDREEHLRAAIEWLAAAQDSVHGKDVDPAELDRGVSHSYLIGERWMRSYPETTGYIIPTLLNYARGAEEEEFARRAVEMADWERTVQREDGSIPDLSSGEPTVFDTGQVMFGFVAAYEHTGRGEFLEAARRGGAWLLRELDDEGVWRHPNDAGGPGRVYNARVAWAMLELARHTGEGALERAARGFLDWGLAQERTPGWYDRNCLSQDTAPLLHTIAYTARGQLECGRLLGDDRYVEASRRTAERVLDHVATDGFVAGRFGEDFRPAVAWACLTGMAQMAIVWKKHAAVDVVGDPPARARAEAFEGAASRVLGFLMRTQDLDASNPGLRGGIRGSFPVNGAYGKWRVLNWATKFFADALMLDIRADALHHRG